MSELELLQRRFQRERAARKEAESLLEEKSREVYQTNQKLQTLAEQLRAQAEQTQAIVDTAAEGIITYDAEGTIQTFNHSAARIFGVPDAIGKNIRQLFATSLPLEEVLFPDAIHTANDDSAAKEESEIGLSASVDAIELVARRGTEGRTFPADLAVSRLNHNQHLIFTALVRDLSKRKELEARLSQAQKMESVGQLAAGIAHEINTPVQFVSNNISFLEGAFEDLSALTDLYQQLVEKVTERQSPGELLSKIGEQCEIADLPFLNSEVPSAIQQSVEGIERVATIVRAMKEFSQPTSESKTAVNVNKSIHNILAISVNHYRDVATLETDLDDSLEPVLCLSGQMNQVLLNVLGNAVEALQEHPPTEPSVIRISTRRKDDAAEIRIQDNGPGIPAEIQDRIFDPFFTTKEVGQGTGQGLAFVYDVIVNKHQGTVLVHSLPGEGTTFIIQLPLSAQATFQEKPHALTVG